MNMLTHIPALSLPHSWGAFFCTSQSICRSNRTYLPRSLAGAGTMALAGVREFTADDALSTGASKARLRSAMRAPMGGGEGAIIPTATPGILHEIIEL